LPFPPAWHQFPLSYNGRKGGITLSGVSLRRPFGLYPEEDTQKVTYRPTEKLDFEMAIAMFVAEPVDGATPIHAKDAADHVFGFVLHNDWSARDVQIYEMAPLGVFNSKSFMTTISPWVVTPDALQGCIANPPPSNATDINPILVCNESDHGLWDIELSSYVSRTSQSSLQTRLECIIYGS
jgi:fumarylacetoacetase